MEAGTSDLEQPLQTPEELLEGLVPQIQDLDMVLDYPREVVERYLYEREGYWAKVIAPRDRAAMIDYIRRVSYSLAWELFSEEDVTVMPEELRKDVSLQGLLEYCIGIFQQLSRLIMLIDRSPNRQLTRERVFVDFSMTRRSGAGSINWLMSHPRSHRFERAAPNGTAAPGLRELFTERSEGGEEVSYLPAQISETHVQVDYNTYENRFVRRFLSTMHRDINNISNLAEYEGQAGVQAEAEVIMRGISELLQYDFLKHSSPSGAPRQPAAIHKQPYYHQIYEISRYYQRIFDFDWGNPMFKLPLRRTWLLYEYWTFFKVIELLRAWDSAW